MNKMCMTLPEITGFSVRELNKNTGRELLSRPGVTRKVTLSPSALDFMLGNHIQVCTVPLPLQSPVGDMCPEET